mmetsp:Transcript_6789/g.11213  ORF Transcript_6789/g.11213 Transcript_6789/m.11213 type:complete len:91 (-) Transcript_6789:17-289(-)
MKECQEGSECKLPYSSSEDNTHSTKQRQTAHHLFNDGPIRQITYLKLKSSAECRHSPLQGQDRLIMTSTKVCHSRQKFVGYRKNYQEVST